MTMAPREHTQTHKALLLALKSAKPKLCKAILQHSEKSLVYSVCEICDNLLEGNIPLTTAQKTQLKKYRAHFRRLAQRGEGWQSKKKYLTQKGGSFLPLLLSAVSAVLPMLFKS